MLEDQESGNHPSQARGRGSLSETVSIRTEKVYNIETVPQKSHLCYTLVPLPSVAYQATSNHKGGEVTPLFHIPEIREDRRVW